MKKPNSPLILKAAIHPQMNADAEGLGEISRFGGIMPLTNNGRGSALAGTDPTPRSR